jgi:hypothetical protein
VDQSWLGMAVGTIVLAIAAAGVIAHYLRERRRADLLRNLDHHEWWQWSQPRPLTPCPTAARPKTR